MAAVTGDGDALQYVKEKTLEICLTAVMQDITAITHVPIQTEDICMTAVAGQGCAISFVRNQTPAICRAAVMQNPFAIQYLHVQTEALCDIAISRDQGAIQFVHFQTFNQCLAATNSTFNMAENLWAVSTYERKLQTVMAHAMRQLCNLFALNLSRSLLIEIVESWIEKCVPRYLYIAMQKDFNSFTIDKILTMANQILSVPRTEYVSEGDIPNRRPTSLTPRRKVFSVWRRTSFDIASRLTQLGYSVCVLNFANNFTPGGPTGLKGNTQEEILMRESNLLEQLDAAQYPLDDVVDEHVRWVYNRLRLAYTGAVTITATNDVVAVITCAAIAMPRIRDGRYASESDRDVTRRKIDMILDTASSKGHKVLIAGEWGCGAFSNPRAEMCELWVEAARRRSLTIVFPVWTREFLECFNAAKSGATI